MNTSNGLWRMAKFSGNAAACSLLVMACVSAAHSQQTQLTDASKLPTAAQVLDRYVEVTGGRGALLRHKSMTVHGRLQAPAQKLDVETVSYSSGTKSLQKAFLVNGKEYASGYDGQVAWDMDPSGKVTLHHGDEVKTIARDADMYYHLHVLDYFKSLEVVDVKNFDSHQCYHLKGVNNWGQPNEQFYDKDSGLLIGYAFNTAWRGGKGDATATFEDYKDFGGVLMPVKTIGREGNDLSISLITSVTYDDVDDAVFALPEAVKKAIAQ
ncbi:MAG: hypothetical protein WA020_14270 [Candidatus Acidiferrales bacterium]